LDNASWVALDCNNVIVGSTIPVSGTTEYTGCVLNTSLVLVNAIILTGADCATTTTTTTVLDCSFEGDADEITTTTTTSTSTSSTTTTTTTITPPPTPYRCIRLDGCDGLGYRDTAYNPLFATVGQVFQYYVFADPSILHCGTVINNNVISIADASIVNITPTTCGNISYCEIPNPTPPLI
jgi:hypothetical protein